MRFRRDPESSCPGPVGRLTLPFIFFKAVWMKWSSFILKCRTSSVILMIFQDQMLHTCMFFRDFLAGFLFYKLLFKQLYRETFHISHFSHGWRLVTVELCNHYYKLALACFHTPPEIPHAHLWLISIMNFILQSRTFRSKAWKFVHCRAEVFLCGVGIWALVLGIQDAISRLLELASQIWGSGEHPNNGIFFRIKKKWAVKPRKDTKET